MHGMSMSPFQIFHQFALMMTIQLWERECKCGDGAAIDGVVQIFSNDIESHANDNEFPLYIPLCLGALVSSKHILTSKYCFGTDEPGTGDNIAKFVWKKKESTFENI